MKFIENEYQELTTAKFNLGCISLPIPIKNCWLRSLELSEDVKRRMDIIILSEVIQAFKHEICGRDNKHVDRN